MLEIQHSRCPVLRSPGTTGSTPIIGAGAGTNSVTMSTAAMDASTFYVVGSSGTNYDQVMLTLSVATGIVGGVANALQAPPPATQPVAAIQPATVPGNGGYRVAFDGTWQDINTGSTISDFYNKYGGTDSKYEYGVGAALANPNILNILPGLVSSAFGNAEAFSLARDAYNNIVKFYANPANHGVSVDMVGWSRGCYEASLLAKWLAAGIPDQSRPVTKVTVRFQGGGSRTVTTTYPYLFLPQIRFMGLISPVNQMGPEDWLGG